MKSKSTSTASGRLYITATPIGHLGDWSRRAAETAQSAAIIACEDTRTSKVLLRHYGITTPTLPYHEHNAETMRPKLLERLAVGESIVLMSDAGTPLISDPGYKLVRAAQEAGYEWVAVPGASSPIAALSIAGLPTDAFYFGGFLPPKSAARRRTLEELSALRATLVFLESPGRLGSTLMDVQAVLGERQVCVCREMTKRFEEARRGPVTEILAHYEAVPPKGEIVVLVAGADGRQADEKEVEICLRRLLKDHSLKEAVAIAAEQTGLSRKEVYALALELKEKGQPHDKS